MTGGGMTDEDCENVGSTILFVVSLSVAGDSLLVLVSEFNREAYEMTFSSTPVD